MKKIKIVTRCCLMMFFIAVMSFAGMGCKKSSSGGSGTNSGGGVQDPNPAPDPDPITYDLQVGKSGEGNGTIQSDVAGISCGDTCSAAYNDQTQVTLTAIPDNPFIAFQGWSGDCSGTDVCVVDMTQDINVTAQFGKVSISGEYAGTTSQGKDISFVFEDNGLKITAYTIVIDGVWCIATSEVTITFGNPQPLSEDYSFDVSDPEYQMTGTFESPVSLSGSLEQGNSDCRGTEYVTWSATKSVGVTALRAKMAYPIGRHETIIKKEMK
ncbi:hypothetical protein BVX98_03880 [bacterium F11]|nr:hypothetical protein BVX98_03880 [bacterium F11]